MIHLQQLHQVHQRLLLEGLMLAACSRGPDANTLQADLKARLQQVFGSRLQLRDVQRRRSSATDSQAPADTERLIVYFDAELELEQAYDFGVIGLTRTSFIASTWRIPQ